MNESTIIVCVLAFVATAAAVVAFWNTFVEASKASAERLDANKSTRSEIDEIVPPLERFIKKGRLLRLRFTFGLVPGVVLFAILTLAGITNVIALILAPLIFTVAGSFVPLLYYKAQVNRRQLAFEIDILDLTIGIGNALRAGMALPQAIEKVGSQMSGPMQEELNIVLMEYRLGIDLVKALDRLSKRMPCEDMRLLVSAIKLTTESGGSLAAVLAEMTVMIRGRREFADKVKALTAEGRFEALAMSCAPIAAFLLLYFQQPDLMRVLYTTGAGWTTLGGVAALEIAGYFTIRKIVSVEV